MVNFNSIPQLHHLVARNVFAYASSGTENIYTLHRLETGRIVSKDSNTKVGHLIEEHILPVGPFGCKLLDDPLRADPVLSTQLLPKLKTD